MVGDMTAYQALVVKHCDGYHPYKAFSGIVHVHQLETTFVLPMSSVQTHVRFTLHLEEARKSASQLSRVINMLVILQP